MVGKILQLMLKRGLSIVRWNNFPRVNDITQMDNVGATLHTALFLAYHEDANLDTLYIIKKIIFISLADLVLSDINSGTKNYIKKLDGAIFDDLYTRAYEYFLKFDAPKYLKEDFKAILFSREHEVEDQIILAAKKYVGYFEAQTNAKVFPEMYDIPLRDIMQELNDLRIQLQSLDLLLRDKKLENYLTHIYRLCYSMRWNQFQRDIPISVMSHKVVVTYLSYIIGMFGNHHGEDNDIENMMLRAIYHDVPEVITGDIITPTKKAVPGFVELLEKVEETMMNDYLFGYISKEYKDFLYPYILEPFEGLQGEKVKYADIFSALLEAKIEKNNNNTIFVEKYQLILSQVSDLDHQVIQFLLQEMLLHFDTLEDAYITNY